jgi:hypothetical protein
MKEYLLVDDKEILDVCLSNSVKQAEKTFDKRGWNIGEVISKEDYVAEMEQSYFEVSLELGG